MGVENKYSASWKNALLGIYIVGGVYFALALFIVYAFRDTAARDWLFFILFVVFLLFGRNFYLLFRTARVLKYSVQTEDIYFDEEKIQMGDTVIYLNNIESVRYGNVFNGGVIGLLAFFRATGIFRVVANDGAYIYLPSTVSNRDELIKKIIQASNLKKTKPTELTSLKTSLATQLGEGGFYRWVHTDGYNPAEEDYSLRVNLNSPITLLIVAIVILAVTVGIVFFIDRFTGLT